MAGTTDPALLAAQAQAGKAGVEAYEAAKNALAKQKQDAVAQAYAEAQARGGPMGAQASIDSTISAPYDDRIASLTAAQARTADAVDRRAGRMVDYNAAVDSARGLIGDQMRQAVAPINAQSEFNLNRIRQEGDNKVAEISAQTRLTQAQLEARMAAAAAKAAAEGGSGGAGSKGTPNATELQGMLAAVAPGRLEAAYQRAEDMVRQSGTTRDTQYRQIGMQGIQAKREAQAVKDYAMQVARKGRISPISAAPIPWQVAAPTSNPLLTGVKPRPTDPDVPTLYGRTLEDRTLEAEQRNMAGGGTNPTKGFGAPAKLGTTPLIAAMNKARALPRSLQQSLERSGPGLENRLSQLDTQRNTAQQDHRQRAIEMMMNLSNPEGLNQADAAMFAPIVNSGRDILNRRDLQETMLGGGSDPSTATEVMKQAMLLSALDYEKEGYKIDKPAMLGAIYGGSTYTPGSTYFDVVGEQGGVGNLKEQEDAQYQAASRANTLANRDTQQEEEGAEQALIAADIKPVPGLSRVAQYNAIDSIGIDKWIELITTMEEMRGATDEDGKPLKWDAVRQALLAGGGLSATDDSILLDSMLRPRW